MRIPILFIGMAFAIGLSVGVVTERAIAPSVVASAVNDGLVDFSTNVNVPTGNAQDIRTVIVRVINFLLSFLSLIAVITIIVSGFVFILGMGSDSSVQRARKIIIYTAVGLFIIYFSRVIVGFFTRELP